MNILEFFKCDDVKHLEALDHLENTGKFPEGFLPSDIERPPPAGWYWRIYAKLGRKFLAQQLALRPNMLPTPSGSITGE